MYQFNGGWLYNSKVDTSARKRVDRELTGLRKDGVIRSLTNRRTAEYEKIRTGWYSISGILFLIPNMLFVLPLLTASVLALLLWKPIKTHDERVEQVVSIA